VTSAEHKRIMLTAARKALETAERLAPEPDACLCADFVDAVVLGAVERLRRDGHSDQDVLLWRETFFENFRQQTDLVPRRDARAEGVAEGGP
jgi:hypothetical protein